MMLSGVERMRHEAENVRKWGREKWVEGRVGALPLRWSARMRLMHAQMLADGGEFRANTWLRETSEEFGAYRIAPDASDADVRGLAKRIAGEVFSTASATGAQGVEAVRAAMAVMCGRWGVEVPGAECQDRPAIARMTCEYWWRRKLRKVHARGVEHAAIRLGYVHRRADLYASEEAVKRRREQKARNAETMASVELENEAGDRYTLQKLAALSVANPRIRRGELMARIAGFEGCAKADGHAGEFVTVSCPSRMHARLSKSGAANPKYDGTTPKEAQAHLVGALARFRAWAARKGVGFYGFRIAEPHHDGCPHWHLLMFMPAEFVGDFRFGIDLYFRAQHDGQEPGALENRCKFVAIDWARGSAAGYVAKYVSKNIDGADVGEDLEGRPAVESAIRVDAWASTWGIRQFQQVSGPAVGVWRELRRVPASDVPELEQIRGAADVGDWQMYVQAMGGAVLPRRDRPASVCMVAGEGRNSYGEPAGDVPYGVVLNGSGQVFKSARQKWRVVGAAPGISEGEREGMREESARVLRVLRKESGRAVGSFFEGVVLGLGFQGGGEAGAPWSPVNNCTGGDGGKGRGIENAGGAGSGAGEIQGRSGGWAGAGGSIRRAAH